ncbi:MAG: hypothetical protein C4297_08355 [Gemmataceae bacterium]
MASAFPSSGAPPIPLSRRGTEAVLDAIDNLSYNEARRFVLHRSPGGYASVPAGATAAMKRSRQRITNAELRVLHALWDLHQATVRQLMDRLYPGGGPARYATVQKLLERLVAKKYVARARTAQAVVYRPARTKEAVLDEQLRDVAARLCGGSLTPLLSHLLQHHALSPQERKQLLDLIASPPGRGS